MRCERGEPRNDPYRNPTYPRLVNPDPRDEDEAWRDIVDNYGDAPDFDEPAPQEPASREGPVYRPGSADDPDAWHPTPWEDEGRFVPPSPAPIPLAEPRRLTAWGGLVAAPLVLLIVVVFGWTMPGWLASLLVMWFIGGFGYLVWTMQSGPRDPGDDGARL